VSKAGAYPSGAPRFLALLVIIRTCRKDVQKTNALAFCRRGGNEEKIFIRIDKLDTIIVSSALDSLRKSEQKRKEREREREREREGERKREREWRKRFERG
jgi:hypothetical protein